MSNSDPIVIDNVQPGGNDDGNDLLECYFKAKSNGTFDFFDKDGKEKVKDIHVGQSFSFELDEYPDIQFTLTIGTGSDTQVTGTWTEAPAGSPPRSAKGPTADPDPTYTAQSQGTVKDEDSAASATA